MVHESKQLIEDILNSPEAPLLVEKLNTVLKEEKKKRTEFYNLISEQQKAEFINGEILIHSPVSLGHNEVNGNLYKILDTYVIENQLGFVGIEKLLIQLTRNDYEPDICFFKKEKSKGFSVGQKFFPPPDLIVEVLSKGTAARDRGIKFQDYQNHGVEEYWLVDPKEKAVEQYHLEKGAYRLVMKSSSGEITSFVVSGLAIPIKILFDKKLTNQFLRTLF